MPDRLSNKKFYVRCIDNRTTRKRGETDDCPNQKRLIGGILEADWLQATFRHSSGIILPENFHVEVLQHKFRGIVAMKQPTEIVVASHEHCGCAAALGYDHRMVVKRHQWWANWFQNEFSHIEVDMFHEEHSECGFHHNGHIPMEMYLPA